MATKTTDLTGLELRKPDAQGRIAIGKEHVNETYAVDRQPNGDILLRPVVVIHKEESWLFSNQEALASVKRGLRDASEGKTNDVGSFAQYGDEEDGDED